MSYLRLEKSSSKLGRMVNGDFIPDVTNKAENCEIIKILLNKSPQSLRDISQESLAISLVQFCSYTFNMKMRDYIF